VAWGWRHFSTRSAPCRGPDDVKYLLPVGIDKF